MTTKRLNPASVADIDKCRDPNTQTKKALSAATQLIEVGAKLPPLWCQLVTLRETIKLFLNARRSSTMRSSSINNALTRRKSISEPHETPNITATVCERGWFPLSYTPYGRNGLRYSVLLPDKSLQYWRLTGTRWRGGTEGTDIV